MVYEPGVLREYRDDNTADDDPIQKMGKVYERLNQALKIEPPYFIQKQRQDDGQRKPDRYTETAELQRVPDDAQHLGIVQNRAERVEARPRAAPDAFRKLYFLKAMTKPTIGTYLNTRKNIRIGKNIRYNGMFIFRTRMPYFRTSQFGLTRVTSQP
jgi:hypothetical protein